MLVIGCTLTPYEGANYYREDFEKVREVCQCVDPHAWQLRRIRRFRSCRLAIPADPKKFRAEFDPGDHLHPNDKGYESMANAIDLGDFQRDEGEAVTGSVAFRSTPKLDRIVIESGWSGPSAFSLIASFRISEWARVLEYQLPD